MQMKAIWGLRTFNTFKTRLTGRLMVAASSGLSRIVADFEFDPDGAECGWDYDGHSEVVVFKSDHHYLQSALQNHPIHSLDAGWARRRKLQQLHPPSASPFPEPPPPMSISKSLRIYRRRRNYHISVGLPEAAKSRHAPSGASSTPRPTEFPRSSLSAPICLRGL